MVLSESEVAVLLAVTAALVLLGLGAWRRGDLGSWYPAAVAGSTFALTIDPLDFPSYSSFGAMAGVALGVVGLLVTVRHRRRLRPAPAAHRA